VALADTRRCIRRTTPSVTEARAGIARHFQFYNHDRQHQSLDYRTPAAIWGRAENLMARCRQHYSVFFPSLSREILWKLGAVSTVRYAAKKPRAPDTGPTFHEILLRRKRREGVPIRQPPRLRKPADLPPPKLNPRPHRH
jgi:hypothetical protein